MADAELVVFGTTEPVHFLHFLAFVFLLTVVLMLVISWVRPADQPPSEPEPSPVDMRPWRHARWVSALVVICTVATYVALAQ